MPTELRHILFRPAEIIQAVREYHRRSRQPLPSGTVVSYAVETEEPAGAIRLRIQLARAPPAGQRDSAVLLYCNMQHIPLPATAEKSLQRFGEQLGLVVTVGGRRDGTGAQGLRI